MFGNDNLNLNSVHLLVDDSNFNIDSTPPEMLEPMDSTEVFISYDPRTYETNEEFLVIQSNDEDESEIIIPLNGTGDAPIIVVTPEEYDFGLTYIGCEELLEISISNAGNVDLEVTDIDYYVTTPQIYIPILNTQMVHCRGLFLLETK